MPRDANGNYTLPAGNPVVTQTDIASTWANDTMSDIGTEMTDSLSRSGKGGMTGPFPIIDKQGSVPGLSFAAEPTSGFKREAAGDIRVASQGTDKLRVLATAGDVQVWRNATWNPVAIEPADRQVMYGEGGVTTLFHYGTTAAPGFEIVEPDANIRELVIGPAAGGGVIGGLEDPTDNTYNLNTTVTTTVTISGTTEGHALTAAENGPHTHEIDGRQTSQNNTGSAPAGTSGTGIGNKTTTSSGSGTPHSHGLVDVPGTGTGTGTGTLQIQPRYARGLLMKLTAYA